MFILNDIEPFYNTQVIHFYVSIISGIIETYNKMFCG